jgi:hypothetical protein
LIDRDHITLAYGRDYEDVCPLSGVILGGDAHALYVSVDVEEWDDETASPPSPFAERVADQCQHQHQA